MTGLQIAEIDISNQLSDSILLLLRRKYKNNTIIINNINGVSSEDEPFCLLSVYKLRKEE